MRIARTWTSPASNQHLSFGFAGSEARIESKSTGGVVPLQIGTNHAAALKFRTNGSNRWQVTGNGDFAANSAGTPSITGARNVELRRFLQVKETTSSISAVQIPDITAAGGGVGIYVKNDLLVISYNISGTLYYMTTPLNGTTGPVSWTASTTAP